MFVPQKILTTRIQIVLTLIFFCVHNAAILQAKDVPDLLQPIDNLMRSYSLLAGSGNAHATAEYLDAFVPAPQSDMEGIYTTLEDLNVVEFGPDHLQVALNRISPEYFGYLPALALRNAITTSTIFLENYHTRRSNCTYCNNCPHNTSCKQKYSSISAQGIIESGQYKNHTCINQSACNEYSYKSSGGAAIIDLWQSHSTLCSIGIGGFHNSQRYGYCKKPNHLNSGHIELYTRYQPCAFFIDGLLDIGFSKSSTNRSIIFADIDRIATSKQKGSSMALHVQCGYDSVHDHYSIVPLGRLSYYYTHQCRFRECSASSLDLDVQGFGRHTLRSQLGAQFNGCFDIHRALFMPQVHIAWAHTEQPDHQCICANLVALGEKEFSIQDASLKHNNSCITDIDMAVQFSCIKLFAHYTLEVGSPYLVNTLRLGLAYIF
jgi:uncharacterized protein YhjY with autotransporter beta-barrel domain